MSDNTPVSSPDYYRSFEDENNQIIDAALEFAHEANEGYARTRTATDGMVLEVTLRSLRELDDQPFSVRRHLTLTDVSHFMSLLQKNKAITASVKNTDILPIAHPRSTQMHMLDIDEYIAATARWIADDPSIKDDSTRAMVASMLTAPEGSAEREYYQTRLENLPQGQVPIRALVAAFKLGANKGFWRFQRRDRKGRFAWMGGGISALVRGTDGTVRRLTGRTVSAGGSEQTRDATFDMEISPGRLARVPAASSEASKAYLASPDAVDGMSPIKARVQSGDEVLEINEVEYPDAPSGFNKLEGSGGGSPAEIDYYGEDADFGETFTDGNYTIRKFDVGSSPIAKDNFELAREAEKSCGLTAAVGDDGCPISADGAGPDGSLDPEKPVLFTNRSADSDNPDIFSVTQSWADAVRDTRQDEARYIANEPPSPNKKTAGAEANDDRRWAESAERNESVKKDLERLDGPVPSSPEAQKRRSEIIREGFEEEKRLEEERIREKQKSMPPDFFTTPNEDAAQALDDAPVGSRVLVDPGGPGGFGGPGPSRPKYAVKQEDGTWRDEDSGFSVPNDALVKRILDRKARIETPRSDRASEDSMRFPGSKLIPDRRHNLWIPGIPGGEAAARMIRPRRNRGGGFGPPGVPGTGRRWDSTGPSQGHAPYPVPGRRVYPGEIADMRIGSEMEQSLGGFLSTLFGIAEKRQLRKIGANEWVDLKTGKTYTNDQVSEMAATKGQDRSPFTGLATGPEVRAGTFTKMMSNSLFKELPVGTELNDHLRLFNVMTQFRKIGYNQWRRWDGKIFTDAEVQAKSGTMQIDRVGEFGPGTPPAGSGTRQASKPRLPRGPLTPEEMAALGVGSIVSVAGEGDELPRFFEKVGENEWREIDPENSMPDPLVPFTDEDIINIGRDITLEKEPEQVAQGQLGMRPSDLSPEALENLPEGAVVGNSDEEIENFNLPRREPYRTEEAYQEALEEAKAFFRSQRWRKRGPNEWVNDFGEFATDADIADGKKTPGRIISLGDEFSTPEGYYDLNREELYTPAGASEGQTSPDFTDDPSELAQRFSEADLKAALKEALEDRNGFSSLEFEEGDEPLPAEALYYALVRKLGVDVADKFVSDVYGEGTKLDAEQELAREFPDILSDDPDKRQAALIEAWNSRWGRSKFALDRDGNFTVVGKDNDSVATQYLLDKIKEEEWGDEFFKDFGEEYGDVLNDVTKAEIKALYDGYPGLSSEDPEEREAAVFKALDDFISDDEYVKDENRNIIEVNPRSAVTKLLWDMAQEFIGTTSSPVGRKDEGSLPPVIDGASDEEKAEFERTGDHTPFLPKDNPESFENVWNNYYNPLPEPYITPEDKPETNPVNLARRFTPDQLKEQLREAILDGSGYGVVAFESPSGEPVDVRVPAEALRDALQLQGEDANDFIQSVFNDNLPPAKQVQRLLDEIADLKTRRDAETDRTEKGKLTREINKKTAEVGMRYKAIEALRAREAQLDRLSKQSRLSDEQRQQVLDKLEQVRARREQEEGIFNGDLEGGESMTPFEENVEDLLEKFDFESRSRKQEEASKPTDPPTTTTPTTTTTPPTEKVYDPTKDLPKENSRASVIEFIKRKIDGINAEVERRRQELKSEGKFDALNELLKRTDRLKALLNKRISRHRKETEPTVDPRDSKLIYVRPGDYRVGDVFADDFFTITRVEETGRYEDETSPYFGEPIIEYFGYYPGSPDGQKRSEIGRSKYHRTEAVYRGVTPPEPGNLPVLVAPNGENYLPEGVSAQREDGTSNLKQLDADDVDLPGLRDPDSGKAYYAPNERDFPEEYAGFMQDFNKFKEELRKRMAWSPDGEAPSTPVVTSLNEITQGTDKAKNLKPGDITTRTDDDGNLELFVVESVETKKVKTGTRTVEPAGEEIPGDVSTNKFYQDAISESPKLDSDDLAERKKAFAGLLNRYLKEAKDSGQVTGSSANPQFGEGELSDRLRWALGQKERILAGEKLEPTSSPAQAFEKDVFAEKTVITGYHPGHQRQTRSWNPNTPISYIRGEKGLPPAGDKDPVPSTTEIRNMNISEEEKNGLRAARAQTLAESSKLYGISSEIQVQAVAKRVDQEPSQWNLVGSKAPAFFGKKVLDLVRGKTGKEIKEELKKKKVVFFDFETSGTGPVSEMENPAPPIQVAAVTYENGKEVSRKVIFINPGIPLGDYYYARFEKEDPMNMGDAPDGMRIEAVIDGQSVFFTARRPTKAAPKWVSDANPDEVYGTQDLKKLASSVYRLDENDQRFLRENRLKDPDGNPVTDEFLASQTSLEDAFKELIDYIGEDAYLSAYNAGFDTNILNRFAEKLGLDYRTDGFIDVLPVARAMYGQGGNSLKELATRYGINVDIDSWHDAEVDSDVLPALLDKVLDDIDDNSPALDVDNRAAEYESGVQTYLDLLRRWREQQTPEAAPAQTPTPEEISEPQEPVPSAPAKTIAEKEESNELDASGEYSDDIVIDRNNNSIIGGVINNAWAEDDENTLVVPEANRKLGNLLIADLIPNGNGGYRELLGVERDPITKNLSHVYRDLDTGEISRSFSPLLPGEVRRRVELDGMTNPEILALINARRKRNKFNMSVPQVNFEDGRRAEIANAIDDFINSSSSEASVSDKLGGRNPSAKHIDVNGNALSEDDEVYDVKTGQIYTITKLLPTFGANNYTNYLKIRIFDENGRPNTKPIPSSKLQLVNPPEKDLSNNPLSGVPDVTDEMLGTQASTDPIAIARSIERLMKYLNPGPGYVKSIGNAVKAAVREYKSNNFAEAERLVAIAEDLSDVLEKPALSLEQVKQVVAARARGLAQILQNPDTSEKARSLFAEVVKLYNQSRFGQAGRKLDKVEDTLWDGSTKQRQEGRSTLTEVERFLSGVAELESDLDAPLSRDYLAKVLKNALRPDYDYEGKEEIIARARDLIARNYIAPGYQILESLARERQRQLDARMDTPPGDQSWSVVPANELQKGDIILTDRGGWDEAIDDLLELSKMTEEEYAEYRRTLEELPEEERTRRNVPSDASLVGFMGEAVIRNLEQRDNGQILAEIFDRSEGYDLKISGVQNSFDGLLKLQADKPDKVKDKDIYFVKEDNVFYRWDKDKADWNNIGRQVALGELTEVLLLSRSKPTKTKKAKPKDDKALRVTAENKGSKGLFYIKASDVSEGDIIKGLGTIENKKTLEDGSIELVTKSFKTVLDEDGNELENVANYETKALPADEEILLLERPPMLDNVLAERAANLGTAKKPDPAAQTELENEENNQEIEDELGSSGDAPTKFAMAVPSAEENRENVTPTTEQASVLDAVRRMVKRIKVQAFAGTGKTTTLKMVAKDIIKRDPNARVMVIMFGIELSKDTASKMPKGVEVVRTGQLADRFLKKNNPNLDKKRKNQTSPKSGVAMTAQPQIKALGISGPQKIVVNGEEKELGPEETLTAIKSAVKKYNQSADRAIGPQHFEGMDEVPERLLNLAQLYFDQAVDPNGKIPIDFGEITKIWSLSNPDLTAGSNSENQYLFYDEAQDINPAVESVLLAQKNFKSMVWVGDTGQAIFEFAGAVDGLQRFEADEDLALTETFRFGEAIAGFVNRFIAIRGEKKRIRGSGPEGSVVPEGEEIETPEIVISRTNAGGLEKLQEYAEQGKNVVIEADTLVEYNSLINGILWLRGQKNRTTPAPKDLHPDLAGFRDYEELLNEKKAGNLSGGISSFLNMLGKFNESGNDIDDFRSMISGFNVVRNLRTAKKYKDYKPISFENIEAGPVKLNSESDAGKIDVHSAFAWVDEAGNLYLRGFKYGWEYPGLQNSDESALKAYFRTLGAKYDFDAPLPDAILKTKPRLGGETEKKKTSGAYVLPAGSRLNLDENGRWRLINEISLYANNYLGRDGDPVSTMTAHKAKGREWDSVVLAGDFPGPKFNEETLELEFPSDEELRIQYVAASRAKKILDPGPLRWIYDETTDEDEKYVPPGDPRTTFDMALPRKTTPKVKFVDMVDEADKALTAETQRVLDAINKSLADGSTPAWLAPWEGQKTSLPLSVTTGNPYSGTNSIYLQAVAKNNEWTDSRWITQAEINKRGAKVKDGQLPTRMTNWLPNYTTVVDENGEALQTVYSVSPEDHFVYNVEQVDGLNLGNVPMATPSTPSEAEEALLSAYVGAPDIVSKRIPTEAETRGGAAGAEWNSSTDTISLPRREQFSSPEKYFEALAHELIHSTGSYQRLGRETVTFSRGMASYSNADLQRMQTEEEFIAQLGTAILANRLGVDLDIPNVAAYIKQWQDVYGNSPDLLARSARQAQEAADYIFSGKAPTPPPPSVVSYTFQLEAPRPVFNLDVPSEPTTPAELKKDVSEQKTKTQEISQKVTDMVVQAIKDGKQLPWNKPWTDNNIFSMPYSVTSNKAYKGSNIVALWVASMVNDWSDNRWITFNEAKKRGGTVKKGSKGTQIVNWSPVIKKVEQDDGSTKDEVAFMRPSVYTVFNIEQTEGVKDLPEPELFDPVPITEAEQAALSRYTDAPPIVNKMQDAAFWRPSTDEITMPLREQFADVDGYVATLFHELIHSTGHNKRLDRTDLGDKYSTHNDARGEEELIAEIGSAILAARLGLELNLEQTAGYAQSWLRALENDPDMITKAAQRADAAVGYILGDTTPRTPGEEGGDGAPTNDDGGTPASPTGGPENIPPSTLSAEQENALQWYTDGGFDAANRALRKGETVDPEDTRKIDELLGLISSSKTTSPLSVYRGRPSANAERASELLNLEPGDEITDSGVMSTSLDFERAKFYANMDITDTQARAIVKINVPEGSSAFLVPDEFATYNSDKEVLLPPGSTLRVTSVSDGDGIRNIEADLVEGEPYRGESGRTGEERAVEIEQNRTFNLAVPNTNFGENGAIQYMTPQEIFDGHSFGDMAPGATEDQKKEWMAMSLKASRKRPTDMLIFSPIPGFDGGLYASMKKKGFDASKPILLNYRDPKDPQVAHGHHRLAVALDLFPGRKIPVKLVGQEYFDKLARTQKMQNYNTRRAWAKALRQYEAAKKMQVPRPNEYSGKCEFCGEKLERGEGQYIRVFGNSRKKYEKYHDNHLPTVLR